MLTPSPFLRVDTLSKRYGSVQAVGEVSFEIRTGEVLAIVGDNGAGKTTLVKMLAGALHPDSGLLHVNGLQYTHFASVAAARSQGIEMVYQDLGLIDNLDVLGNLFLGRELKFGGLLKPFGILDERRMLRVAERELGKRSIALPPLTGRPVGRLSGGQRQAVAIARAILWASQLIIMDEPTAALGVAESQVVLRLVKQARDQGMGIVIISHILPHVIELADRVVVMRHGRKIAELTQSDLTHEDLVSLIVSGHEKAPNENEARDETLGSTDTAHIGGESDE